MYNDVNSHELKFFIYTFTASVIMLVGFMALYFETGAETFSMIEIESLHRFSFRCFRMKKHIQFRKLGIRKQKHMSSTIFNHFVSDIRQRCWSLMEKSGLIQVNVKIVICLLSIIDQQAQLNMD